MAFSFFIYLKGIAFFLFAKVMLYLIPTKFSVLFFQILRVAE